MLKEITSSGLIVVSLLIFFKAMISSPLANTDRCTSKLKFSKKLSLKCFSLVQHSIMGLIGFPHCL